MKVTAKPTELCARRDRVMDARGKPYPSLRLAMLCLVVSTTLFMTGCARTISPGFVSSTSPSYGEGGLNCCYPIFYQDSVTRDFVTRGWYAFVAVKEVQIVVPGFDTAICQSSVFPNKYLPIAKNWRGTGVTDLSDDYWSDQKEYMHVRLFMNANFFRVDPYVKCGKAYGWTVSGGVPISSGIDTDNGRYPDALVFLKGDAREVRIMSYQEAEKIIKAGDVENAVSGYQLLRDGSYVAQPQNLDENRSLPRTAVGLLPHSTLGTILYMVSVNPGNNGDKDKPHGFGGTSLPGLAVHLLSLGIKDAINLDGGGSAQFLARLPGTATHPQQEYTSFPSDCRMQQKIDDGKVVGAGCSSTFGDNQGIVPLKSSVYRPFPIFLGIGPPLRSRE